MLKRIFKELRIFDWMNLRNWRSKREADRIRVIVVEGEVIGFGSDKVEDPNLMKHVVWIWLRFVWEAFSLSERESGNPRERLKSGEWVCGDLYINKEECEIAKWRRESWPFVAWHRREVATWHFSCNLFSYYLLHSTLS